MYTCDMRSNKHNIQTGPMRHLLKAREAIVLHRKSYICDNFLRKETHLEYRKMLIYVIHPYESEYELYVE